MNNKTYDITDLEPVSACCGAYIICHDLCGDCHEHCENIYETEDGIFVDEDGQEYQKIMLDLYRFFTVYLDIIIKE